MTTDKKSRPKPLKQRMSKDPYPTGSLVILKQGAGKTTLPDLLKQVDSKSSKS